MPKQMPIYKAEAQAGIADAISATENHVIASLCPLLANNQVVASVQDEVKVKDSTLEQLLSVNRDQFDLHYLYTILASTGWNDNDDVFDRYETWASRDTAEDKPFNIQHDPNRIIGHITGNCVVDINYELVNNELTVDELPEKFHILTSAVIYKHLQSKDPNLAQETTELLSEIAQGRWFVSMEALFANFDYAVITPSNDHKMIVRSEDTAFLSKHLRAYGGSGDYQGNRVGRLIRNLTFSGKGLVKVPGNPESIIFDNEDNAVFRGMAAASIQPITNLPKETGDVSMAETNEQIRTLESQIQELKTSNDALENRLKAMDEAQVQAKFDTLDADVSSRDEQIVALTAKVKESQADSAKSAQSLQELEEVKAKSEKKLGELTDKLAAIDAEIIKTNRISALVDKGVEKVSAEAIVETYSGISDEQFEAVVNTHGELVQSKNDKKNEVSAENEEEALKKADAESENDSEGSDDEAGDAETLAQAEAEKDAALTVSSENEGDLVMASLSKYFTGVLGGGDNESQS
jgi:hypothetical protein